MNKALNFIEKIVEEDLANGMDPEKLRFRFPPEPNGYLHIGHAASICLNFGLGQKYNAPVNLRFDDTNPAKEEQEYVDAIKKDIKWLGFEWDKELYSSDYFDELYNWAIEMIKEGRAYVDSQSAEEIAAQKGTPTESGVDSPYRNRSVEENLELFQKMKDGEFDSGSHVLRAKIAMSAKNMHMRDPIMYRVVNKSHHRTGDKWKIYPMYDWTHGESDYIEQVSHSICTLEFKAHRELYNWYVKQVYDEKLLKPKQREFARRNLSYTVMSKRKLKLLVDDKHVSGWDDPRMPTISGMRRRGYTADSIKEFSDVAGISKRENVTDIALLEFQVRKDLNNKAARVMGVVDPVKLIITNYPENKSEMMTVINNPEDESMGSREIEFSKELYIERNDFMEDAPKKYFRLSPGRNVRLKSAYIIHCDGFKKDDEGNLVEVYASYIENSKSGEDTSGVKSKGVLHWVSTKSAVPVELRVYDRLFSDENPDGHKDKHFLEFINPNSLTIKKSFVEKSLLSAKVGEQFQFMRKGYFCLDPDSTKDNFVFNKVVGLRDSWKK